MMMTVNTSWPVEITQANSNGCFSFEDLFTWYNFHDLRCPHGVSPESHQSISRGGGTFFQVVVMVGGVGGGGVTRLTSDYSYNRRGAKRLFFS